MEEVSGKNVNLCHIIANPDRQVLACLAIEHCAIGIVSVSPGEAAFAAANFLSKAASLEVVFIDRYLGTVLVTGRIAAIETACRDLMDMLVSRLEFERTAITYS